MKSTKKNKLHKLWKTPTKWIMFGLIMGVVLATVGSIGAFNGWFGGGGAIPSDTLTRGLVGYWPMEEGSGTIVHDSSNYANHATTSGTAPSWTKGKVGSALSFDGSDDYVRVANDLDITGDITIGVWVKPAATQKDYADIISKHANGGFALEQNAGNTNQYYFVWDTIGTGEWQCLSITTTLTANVWQYFAISKSGTSLKHYLNGVESASCTSSSATTTITTNALNLRIGDFALSGGREFNGLIDEVRIYNRALSAEEIRYHYNRGGPVAQWKFDEGEGRTAYDSTENNNDGTLQLAPSGNIATSTAWVAGKYGSALQFDGVDDYVVSSANSGITGNAEFTIEAWIKRNNYNSNGQVVAGFGDSSTAVGAAYLFPDVNGDGSIGIEFAGANGFRTAAGYIKNGVWNHLVATKKVGAINATTKLYLNGAEIAPSVASVNTPNITNEKFYIGKFETDSTYMFNGLIDDVRIYNYARTPDEIRLDYNAGFAALFGPQTSCDKDPGACMTNGLVGYWPMEEGSGLLAYDSSGYANNGTLTSGPSWDKGKVGGALSLDGSNDYLNVGDISAKGSIKTVEFWINNSNATDGVLELVNNTNYVSISSSAVSTTGFTNPNTYINGLVATALASGWNHVVITADAISPTSFLIGEANTDFMSGLIDEVRVYNRVLSAQEVRYHYNKGGPVAQWKFDEGEGRTAYDSTENNNDGTLQLAPSGNIATSTAWVAGKYGSAIKFDGVDDYIEVPDSSLWDFGTGGFSISMWVYFNGTPAGWLIDQGGEGATIIDRSGWSFRVGTDSIVYRYYNASHTGIDNFSLPANLIANSWNHIAIVRDDSSKIRVFSNGSAGAPQTSAANITGTNYTLRIGQAHSSGPGGFVNGLIDDVRIYNYARTPDEIRLDYNAGFAALFGPQTSCDKDPGACMTNGLVGYWPMEEGSGTIVHDSSNYANHATTSGTAPIWTKGKVGGALSFDGDDSVNAGSGASLNLTGAITIEAWIKPASLAVADQNNVIAGNGQWQVAGYYLQEGANADDVVFASNQAGAAQFITSNRRLSINNWYHVVAVRSGTVGKIYINGIDETLSSDSILDPTPTSNNFLIGKYAFADDNFNGLIDEVRIYNRALSADEIRYHYNRGGPVAQWKFDEGEGRTAYDSTENNNDGTLQLAPSGNIATSTAWVSGKYGSALSFDGVDDYVNAGAASNLNITGNITIGAWIKTNSAVSSHNTIVGKYTANGGYILLLGQDTFDTARGEVQFRVYYSGGEGLLSVGSNTLVNDGKWHYVVGVWNSGAGNEQQIYVDGVLERSKDQPTPPGTTSNNLNIGRLSDTDSFYFNGLIDDVRVYNYARTPEQIRLDYNTGLSTHFK